MKIRELLASKPVEASAPCRIDMGGTLDLTTFSLPLRQFQPCTFNAALDLRTQVRISTYTPGKIKVSSVGFESVVFDSANAPFNHKLGLMLAVAAYFNVDGILIDIRSASPPRSALGGSSVAAAALIWSFFKAFERGGQTLPDRRSVALLAHAIEQSVAGVPCGLQDQLAAVYGGINAWFWQSEPSGSPFRQQCLFSDNEVKEFEDRILVAYCGAPHVSKDVNAAWVNRFVSGQNREQWQDITQCSRTFVSALASGDYSLAMEMMNQETQIRCRMTPEVLDEVGLQLVAAAVDKGCGARFTGAGGGGCLWALGMPDEVTLLRPVWEKILAQRKTAKLLDARIDTSGLL